jgi:hypothetical protein
MKYSLRISGNKRMFTARIVSGAAQMQYPKRSKIRHEYDLLRNQLWNREHKLEEIVFEQYRR